MDKSIDFAFWPVFNSLLLSLLFLLQKIQVQRLIWTPVLSVTLLKVNPPLSSSKCCQENSLIVWSLEKRRFLPTYQFYLFIF